MLLQQAVNAFAACFLCLSALQLLLVMQHSSRSSSVF
jgi:hypothetical protein